MGVIVRKQPAGLELGRPGLWATEQRKRSSEKGEKIQGRQIFNLSESKGRLLIQGNRIKAE